MLVAEAARVDRGAAGSCPPSASRTNAGAEFDHAIARPRSGGSRQQNSIVADAMAALLLNEAQTAAKHHIVGGFRLRPARQRP